MMVMSDWTFPFSCNLVLKENKELKAFPNANPLTHSIYSWIVGRVHPILLDNYDVKMILNII